MPKIKTEDVEQSLSGFSQAMQQTLENVSSIGMSYPVFVVGCSRLLNTGNFENLSMFAGLTVPVPALPNDIENFQSAVNAAAELGFGIVSEEVNSRYESLKQMQKEARGGR